MTLIHKTLATSLRKGAGGNGAPSAEQLAAINGLTLRDFTADELYTREFIIAHNAIDRDREVIDDALLASFTKTLPGKGLFIKHPMSFDGDSGPGEGRWFAARTETMSLDAAKALLREPELKLPPDRTQVAVLIGNAYLLRSAESNPLINKIDAGIAGDVSIGFSHSGRADVIDPVTSNRVAVRLLGPGEAHEASLVWLGAQPGARAIKHAKETTMTDDVQKNLDTAKQEIIALKAAVDASKAASDELAALKTAFGTSAELLKTPAVMLAHIDAGKTYIGSLVDDLIKADRLAGRVGDTDAAVKSARDMYTGMSTMALKHLHGALIGAAPLATLTASDPNAGKPALNTAKGAVPDALTFIA